GGEVGDEFLKLGFLDSLFESDWDAIKLGIKWAGRLIAILPEECVPRELLQLALNPSNLRATIEQPLVDFA
ncbi:hypothetical protein HKBW3S44_01976, partial [Candidatus Hakubella thermalkaliphila]